MELSTCNEIGNFIFEVMRDAVEARCKILTFEKNVNEKTNIIDCYETAQQ